MKNALGAQGSQTVMRKPGGISEPPVSHSECAARRPAQGAKDARVPSQLRAIPAPPLEPGERGCVLQGRRVAGSTPRAPRPTLGNPAHTSQASCRPEFSAATFNQACKGLQHYLPPYSWPGLPRRLDLGGASLWCVQDTPEDSKLCWASHPLS